MQSLVKNGGGTEEVKLSENIFRAANIALLNELKVIYERMGIDVWEVIEAAKTKPFGYMPFYPGPGLGGHCIPIDPFGHAMLPSIRIKGTVSTSKCAKNFVRYQPRCTFSMPTGHRTDSAGPASSERCAPCGRVGRLSRQRGAPPSVPSASAADDPLRRTRASDRAISAAMTISPLMRAHTMP